MFLNSTNTAILKTTCCPLAKQIQARGRHNSSRPNLDRQLYSESPNWRGTNWRCKIIARPLQPLKSPCSPPTMILQSFFNNSSKINNQQPTTNKQQPANNNHRSSISKSIQKYHPKNCSGKNTTPRLNTFTFWLFVIDLGLMCMDYWQFVIPMLRNVFVKQNHNININQKTMDCCETWLLNIN